jgi:hypothetical protein
MSFDENNFHERLGFTLVLHSAVLNLASLGYDCRTKKPALKIFWQLGVEQ